MSLIQYPSSIKPARVTSRLERSDELFVSPVTGIQQTSSRGNAYWRHTLEYRDLSDSERDVVQGFLMKCKGSLNVFKIPDFGHYGTNAENSDWIDIFESRGDFLDQADHDYFTHAAGFDKTLLQGGGLLVEHRDLSAAINIQSTPVNSFDAGGSYCARVKLFVRDKPVNARIAVGSAYDALVTEAVNSSAQISGTFFSDQGSIDNVSVYTDPGAAIIGDTFRMDNFRVSRVPVVTNSEQLLTWSNVFSATPWAITGATRFLEDYAYGPTGVQSSSWKIFMTAVNSRASIQQSHTKPQTEDLYCGYIYARAQELSEIRLELDRGSSTDSAHATFWLSSGSITNQTENGNFNRLHASMFPVGSNYYKCKISAVVTSHNAVRFMAYVSSGTGIVFTNNGSDGIDIYGAGLRQGAYPGVYCPTSGTAVVASYQSGSQLYVEGLEPGVVAYKSGARFEVITRYHDSTTMAFELSEMKRLTTDLKASREGWGVAEFDPPLRNQPIPSRYAKFAGTNFLGETIANALIFDQPETRVRLVSPTIQYIEKPLRLTDVVFDVIEDLTE